MRHTAAILVLLLAAGTAQAGPRNWLHSARLAAVAHPKTVKFAVAIVAASVHAAGLKHCRQGSVENCDGKYGAAWGIFATVTVANLIMVPVSEKIEGKTGWAVSLGSSGAQLGHGIYEWRKKANETHVDMSRVVLIRH